MTDVANLTAFQAQTQLVDGQLIARLPDDASRQLPSRGQISVEGAINGHRFRTVLEPDGASGHWIRLDSNLQAATGIAPGETIEVEVAPTKDWPEPQIPPDIAAELSSSPPHIQEMWEDITPMARWEWVRWVNATRNPATRKHRVQVMISKMDDGKRRPCCFNRAACTDPDLSRSGKLIGAK